MLARLRVVEGFEIARDPQQRIQRVFGHLHRHARIFQADDTDMRGDLGHLQQGIDTRAQVEQGLQGGLVLEELDRRTPHQGDFRARRRTIGIPHGNAAAGHGGFKARHPGVGIVVGAGKEDVHGGCARGR
ncbi:hypothetical protein D3C72_1860670 [compost metagenome]